MSSNALSGAELARMEQLCEGATPGPWSASIERRDHLAGPSMIQTAAEGIELTGTSDADHDFIANARQDVPRLLREVRALRSQPASSGLTESELATIEQRCEAATAGPWTSYIEGRDMTSGSTFIQTAGEDLYLTPGESVANHDFIASARQDVPRLVREVRALRKVLAGSGE